MLKKRLSKLLLLGAFAGLAVAATLLLLPGGPPQSLKAKLEGLQELTVSTAGKVQFVALPGQKVRAGDILLRVDVMEYIEQAQEAEKTVKALAASVPGRYGSLMSAYLSIPQSEDELAEEIIEASAQEKLLQEHLERQSAELAALSVQIRKLELKKEKQAAELAELKDKLQKEEQLREGLNTAYKAHEQASLHRAYLEKQLDRKQNLARSLRSVPPAAQDNLRKMAEVFSSMYELEKKILLSVIVAPQNGLVTFTVLSEGDEAGADAPALYLLPSGAQPEVIAWFSKKQANKIPVGAACTVSFVQGGLPLEFSGVIAERLTYVDKGGDSEVPLRIKMPSVKAEQFVGVKPTSAINVIIKE